MEMEDDRLSMLPDCVLIHLLSFLPTIEAVRTLILSKRFRNLYTSFSYLNFNCDHFKSLYPFANFIQNLLSLRDGSAKVHHFCLSALYPHPSFQAALNYAFLHGVEKVEIYADFGFDCLGFHPLHSFRCDSLRILKLKYSGFLGSLAGNLSFIGLISLHLEGFKVEDVSCLIQGFPSLEDLSLIDCSCPKILSLSAPQLVRLTLSSPLAPFSRISLSTPKLSWVNFRGAVPLQFSVTHELDQLETVSLECRYSHACSKQREFECLDRMLNCLRHAKSVSLSSSTVDILSFNIHAMHCKVMPFSDLRSLNLMPPSTKQEGLVVSPYVRAYLLDNSPNAKITGISLKKKTTVSTVVNWIGMSL